jgi:hypothetical protein
MIQAGVITAVTTLGKMGLGIIDQLVEDKDLKQKLAIKQIELTYGLIEKLINTTTIPWVDAFVKLMTGLIVLARPLGSFVLTCVGIYMHLKGVEIDQAVHYGLDAAFPAWGAAREAHKKREADAQKRGVSAYQGLPPWE